MRSFFLIILPRRGIRFVGSALFAAGGGGILPAPVDAAPEARPGVERDAVSEAAAGAGWNALPEAPVDIAPEAARAAATATSDVVEAGDPGDFRIGITFAGTSLVGLTLEHQWGDRSAELTVGTISFRDISISLVGKQYLSGGSLRPFVGLGLWTMVAFQETGRGAALILRAPVGAAWQMSEGHFLGGEMNLNRALAINRVDPEDDKPPNTGIVPIPGLFYRYRIDG